MKTKGIVKRSDLSVQNNIAGMKAGISRSILLSVFLAALAVFVLLPTSAQAQSVVKFTASESFQSDEVTLRAKLYKPTGKGRFPAVVLMHGCGGWQPSVQYSLQSHANYLVKKGYVVLSVDSFGPRHQAGGKVCESFRLLKQARDYRTSDAFDALRYLQEQSFVNPDNIFLMGQSNGGSVAIIAAKEATAKKYRQDASGFRAVAAYYPWCGAFGGSRVTLGAPLMVLGGGQDDWVPPKKCEQIRASGADYQVQIYPDAVHSFDLEIMKQRYNGKLVGYSKSATQDSRAKMAAFFDANLTSDLKKTHLAAR